MWLSDMRTVWFDQLPEDQRFCFTASNDQIDRVLPMWAWRLPSSVKRRVLFEHRCGNVAALTPQAIRDYGESHWMRVPGFGRKSLAALWRATEDVT